MVHNESPAATPTEVSQDAPIAAEAQGDDLVAEMNTRIRQEILAARRGGIARVKSVDAGGWRVTVALKQSPETLYHQIPVLTPFAAPDGTGDSLPLVEGETEGLVMFVHDPMKELLATRGTRPQLRFDRSLAGQTPVFLPAQLSYDDEEPPEAAAEERVIGHPSGSHISIKPNGDIRIEHTDGPAISITEDGVVHE